MNAPSSPPGSDFGPVQLDLLTAGVRISGTTQDADPRRRLSDVLNGQQNQIIVTQVMLRDLEGRGVDSCELIVVEKAKVVIVVPRESAGQLALQRASRFGIAPPATQPVAVVILAPPFVATGLVAFRDAKEALRGAAGLAPFFPVVDAVITQSGSLVEKAPVILINRDAVVGLGLRQRPTTASPYLMAPPPREAVAPPADRLGWLTRPEGQPGVPHQPSAP